MTVRRFALLILALAACDGSRSAHGPNTGGDGGTASSGMLDPAKDSDGDGYSPMTGDCDDTTPLVGPNSVEVANNGIDDDCDGKVDNAASCDTSIAGMKTADALAQAMGICAKKFLTGAKFVGPSDPVARNTVTAFGVLKPLEGAAMSFISSGEASTSASYEPQSGTSLDNSFDTPYKVIQAPPTNGCGSGPPPTVNDYTELALDLTVPYNANSLSFQFQFFSAEYPEFVCTTFNDRFLVILDDNTGQPVNIAFDNNKNPISVNNGFFTVCKNSSSKPQTQHCTHPVTDIAGTGYDVSQGGDPVGGSTGWLTTTTPVTPGDKIKLRFIVFDEGDNILDSAALIDNFQWLTNKVDGPITVQ